MNFINSLITKTPGIKIILDNQQNNTTTIKDIKGDNIILPLYNDWDIIKGKVVIDLNRNKNYHHQGIKIEFFGLIENSQNKKLNSKFLTLCKDLESPNELYNEITQFEFEFNNVEKPYDSYRGNLNILKYLLKATLSTSYKNIECDQEIIIQKPYYNLYADNEISNPSIQMEVGIEEWIHVSFHVSKSRFYLKDCVEGEVIFKTVSVRLASMELQLIRKESSGVGKLFFF